jgi:ribosomal protein L17
VAKHFPAKNRNFAFILINKRTTASRSRVRESEKREKMSRKSIGTILADRRIEEQMKRAQELRKQYEIHVIISDIQI